MEFVFYFISLLGVAMLRVPPSLANHSVGFSKKSSTSPSAAPLSGEISFSMPLIHQTSPLSPFYKANITEAELFLEELRISRERAQYFSGARRVSRFQIPISHAFVIQYSMGTPAVQTYGIPDTGSDLIWFQCEPCLVCNDQLGSLFDWRKSSTYEVVRCYSRKCTGLETDLNDEICDYDDNCVYFRRYGDGSTTSGNIAEDIMTVVSRRSKILFGCGFNNTDTTGSNVPGVFGLSNSKLSLIGQLGVTAFSYCHDAKNHGALQVGSESARLWGSSTPLVQSYRMFYYVILEDIMVNNEGLNMPWYVFEHITNKDSASGVIIDSGTTITRLHYKAFDALIPKINAHMKRKGKKMYEKKLYETLGFYCWDNLWGFQDPSLPSIKLVFLDLQLTLDANAWYVIDGDICLAFIRHERPFTIIGTKQMRNINVGYDLKNRKLWLQKQSECRP